MAVQHTHSFVARRKKDSTTLNRYDRMCVSVCGCVCASSYFLCHILLWHRFLLFLSASSSHVSWQPFLLKSPPSSSSNMQSFSWNLSRLICLPDISVCFPLASSFVKSVLAWHHLPFCRAFSDTIEKKCTFPVRLPERNPGETLRVSEFLADMAGSFFTNFTCTFSWAGRNWGLVLGCFWLQT